MSLQNLYLVGTSHVAIESVKKVTDTVNSVDPEFIAVELDPQRLSALLSNNKKGRINFSLMRRIGIQGFLFLVVAQWFQQKIGRFVKLEPGSDMLTAVRLAKEQKKKLALVDQNIDLTLSKLSKRLSWTEKWRFFVDLVKGLLFPRKELKKYGFDNIDLTRVPSDEIIRKMMKFFKKRYPNVYQVLVADRNSFMAKRLYKILVDNPESKIVAVIGAGHEEEIRRIVRRLFEANGGVSFHQSFKVDSKI